MQPGQRRDIHAFLPGHADFQLAKFFGKAAQEGFGDRLVHDEHLERGAALPVEGQRAKQAFLGRQLKIGIRQDDGGVLGVQPEYRAQTVRLRMLLLQMVCDFTRPNQGQHVYLTRSQHAWHHHGTWSIHGVDHAFRKGAAERFQQRVKEQRAVMRRLENHRVTHDERRYQRRECLV